MSRLVAPRFDKYVGLNLTLIEYIETSAVYTSGIRNEAYWRWYKCIGNDATDEVIGVEVEVEVDVGGWDTKWPEGLIASDRELELYK